MRTIAGTGAAGHDDAAGKPGTDATFNEPGGITYAAGKLFVADTDNHLIRTISLDGDHPVGTLAMDGVAAPAASAAPGTFAQAGPSAPPPAESTAAADSKPKAESKPSFKDAEQVKVEPVKVKPNADAVHLAVRLDLPDGWKINELAPMRYWLEAEGNAGPVDRSVCGKFHKLDRPVTTFDVRLPVKQHTGKETVTLSMNYYYCQEGENGVCKTSSVVWTIPLELSDEGSAAPVPVTLTVK